MILKNSAPVGIDYTYSSSEALQPLSILLIVLVLAVCIVAGYFITKSLKK